MKYEDCMRKRFSMLSQEQRRNSVYISYVHHIYSGAIDPYTLSMFNISVPSSYNTCHHNLFAYSNSLLIRATKTYNSLIKLTSPSLDICHIL